MALHRKSASVAVVIGWGAGLGLVGLLTGCVESYQQFSVLEAGTRKPIEGAEVVRPAVMAPAYLDTMAETDKAGHARLSVFRKNTTEYFYVTAPGYGLVHLQCPNVEGKPVEEVTTVLMERDIEVTLILQNGFLGELELVRMAGVPMPESGRRSIFVTVFPWARSVYLPGSFGSKEVHAQDLLARDESGREIPKGDASVAGGTVAIWTLGQGERMVVGTRADAEKAGWR